MMTNAHLIHNKRDKLELILRDQNIDLCAISETWLSHNQTTAPLIDGFVHFSKSCDARRGGIIQVKHDFNPITVHHIITTEEFEVVWVYLRPTRLPREISGIFVAVLYFPPNSDTAYYMNVHIMPPLGRSDHNLVLWSPIQDLPSTKNSTLKRVVRPMRDSD